jgi:hypothetical protein
MEMGKKGSRYLFPLEIVGNKKRMFFKWNSRSYLEFKIEDASELGMRLLLCEISLRDYEDMPDRIRVEDFIRNNEFVAPLGVKAFDDTYYDHFSSTDDAFKIIEKYCQCTIYERTSLMELFHCCMAITWLYDHCYGRNATDELITKVTVYDHSITAKSHETIGYWTARAEEMRRNKKISGARAKEIGDINKDCIDRLMKELNISTLNALRGKKKLRTLFIERAKSGTKRPKPDGSETEGLSEKRILDIARSSLKKVNALNAKPPF